MAQVVSRLLARPATAEAIDGNTLVTDHDETSSDEAPVEPPRQRARYETPTSFQIFVRTASRDRGTITLWATSRTTIAELQTQVYEAQGWYLSWPSDLVLMSGTHYLQPTRTLAHYNNQAAARLFCHMQIRGGAGGPQCR